MPYCWAMSPTWPAVNRSCVVCGFEPTLAVVVPELDGIVRLRPATSTEPSARPLALANAATLMPLACAIDQRLSPGRTTRPPLDCVVEVAEVDVVEVDAVPATS